MKFFHATVHSKTDPKHPDRVTSIKVYFPLEAISALKFINNNSYEPIIKKQFLEDMPFEVGSVSSTIQKNQIEKYLEFL